MAISAPIPLGGGEKLVLVSKKRARISEKSKGARKFRALKNDRKLHFVNKRRTPIKRRAASNKRQVHKANLEINAGGVYLRKYGMLAC